MHLNDLPLEILQKILSYLTIKEKFYCERVCRHWQQNVFTSIQSLGFEKFDDVFRNRHQHLVGADDILPVKLNWNDEITKSIISKCGKYLRSYRGFVSRATMLTIVTNCKQLHCANMLFYDLESLKMLSDTFGKQLKCATLYINMRHGITPFIAACSCLSSLAVLKPPYAWYDRSEKSCTSLDLFDLNMQTSALPPSLELLRDLVIEYGYVTSETLKRLVLMTNLDVVRISLTHDLTVSPLWRSVMTSWSRLTILSLEVTSKCCMHFDPLPTNLECLCLRAVGFHSDCEDSKPIRFLTNMPKLKTLLIYQNVMPSDHLSALTESVVLCCPVLEEFSLWSTRSVGLDGCLDEQFSLLFSLIELKTLSLGSKFDISDAFAEKLFTTLKQLTSFGTAFSEENQFCNSLLPSGPLFWKALSTKALLLPTDTFNLAGEVKDTLYLHEPLPSNVFLCITGRVTVSLCNGFSQSEQWQELTERSTQIERMKLELLDVNLNLSGLPKSVEYLTIRCLNIEAGRKQDALIFTTHLPNLEALTMFQQNMSNEQLGTTLEVVGKACPKLRFICLDRGNEDIVPVDEHLNWLLNCQFLDCFCITEKFSVSDEFGAKLVEEVKSIHRFGCCSDHGLGMNCGPLFLKALVSKATKGDYVTLTGGPSKDEIAEKLKPVPIPRSFHIFHPRKLNQ